MSKLNPYNFVRFRPMADDARQTPVWHSAVDASLHSGQLTCQITALSPIFIPYHLEDESKGNQHKYYDEFFHLGDHHPVIPGSSLKGMFRSIAEAAVNGCLSVFSGQYTTNNRTKKPPQSHRYTEPFDLEPAIKELHLQPCHLVEKTTDDAVSGLCPTCRLFGMPAPDEGQDQAGQRPKFFAGKLSFSDARLQGKPVYNPRVTLIELSSPDPTSYLYYQDLENRVPHGRKFYYHRSTIYDSTQRGNRQATIRPLKPATQFEFTVDFNNLTDEELQLLIFTLVLDAAKSDNRWQAGAYHKLGYGKPAGLGSVGILITKWRRLELAGEQGRYRGDGTGWHTVGGKVMDERIQENKKAFEEQYGATINVKDLRAILRYPSPHNRIEYPRFPNEFNADGGYQLPAPVE